MRIEIAEIESGGVVIIEVAETDERHGTDHSIQKAVCRDTVARPCVG
jgi:hypothetical protein